MTNFWIMDSRLTIAEGAYMEGRIDRHQRWVLALRWSARVWSVASVALVLAFIVGEGFNPSGPNEWLGALFFPVGISFGMILAWWKEGLGGIITVGSLLAFFVVHLTTAGTLPKGGAWLVFAAPGFLFLLSSLLSRRPKIGAA
ncbi:MAG: hypothetical protein HY232_09850 [Acidobacteria bacterium]|nr:hypothetical protein [Acidobacteriota bacterium]